MKASRLPILCLLLALTAVWTAPPASARTSVSFEIFYDALDPYGDWMEVSDYGYCWRPRVDDDWAPYSDGYWAYTDAGWTWVSYEEWGWAPYHYGRWVRISGIGWVWVPDYEWAPAWVSWRHSDNHVGWAPLPPRAKFRRDIGFSVWVDSVYDIGPTNYTFCETRHFGNPSLRPVIIDRRRNVTNITVNNNIVYNGGPDFDEVSRRSEKRIERLRLQREEDPELIRGSTRDARGLSRKEGTTLIIAAPTLAPATEPPKPRRVAKKVETAEIDTGWKGLGDEKKTQTLREKMKAQAGVEKPEQAPAKPVTAQQLKPVADVAKTGEPAASPGASPAESPVGTAEASPAVTPGPTPAAGKKPAATLPGETATQPAASPATTPATSPTKPRRERGKSEASPGASPGVMPAASPTARTEPTRRPKKPVTEALPAATGVESPVIERATPRPTASPAEDPRRGRKAKVLPGAEPAVTAMPTVPAAPKKAPAERINAAPSPAVPPAQDLREPKAKQGAATDSEAMEMRRQRAVQQQELLKQQTQEKARKPQPSPETAAPRPRREPPAAPPPPPSAPKRQVASVPAPTAAPSVESPESGKKKKAKNPG